MSEDFDFDAAMAGASGPVGMRPGDERATWIIVDRTPDGAYFPAIVTGGDRTWPLEDAAGYARTLLAVCEDACHDAAIVRLMTERLHQPLDYARWFVMELRQDRPDYDDAPTAPLTFRPMVASKTGLPWVDLQLDGERLGRWTPDAARQHAAYVLAAPHVADLDTAIVRQLRTGFEMSLDAAASLVDDLSNFREDHHDGERR